MKIPILRDKKNLVYSTFLLFILFLTSCGSSRNLVYFSDLQESTVYRANITNANEPRIQPDDLLGITVNTLEAQVNIQFKTGVFPTQVNGEGTNSSSAIDGYLVDKGGFVTFPTGTIGRVKLGGLTKEEAKEKIITELKKQVKGTPVVNVRYLNFKVTVTGEVNRPNTFTLQSEKINIMEALSMAGDITVFGKKENVLLIREKGGQRNITRLNLNSKEALNSPYFYLQQNDLIIVEADKTKMSQTNAMISRQYISIIAAFTSIVTLVVTRIIL